MLTHDEKRVVAQNAARVILPTVKQDGEPTLPKLCPRCNQMMPHKLRHEVCILCEFETEGEKPC